MIAEPADRVVLDLFERARLLEQMAGALDDDQLLRRAQPAIGHPVQLDDLRVEAADDQQGRRGDVRQRIAGEIGAAAARHDRLRRARHRRCRQGRSGAGAGPERADRQVRGLRRRDGPVGGEVEAGGEQRDVEDVGAVALFGRGQKVEQQGREPRIAQCRGYPIVARAQSAAAAAMREDDEPLGIFRQPEQGLQPLRPNLDLNRIRDDGHPRPPLH